MQLKELYDSINGDYEQALKVLRVEKLIDKHIRKLTKNGVVEDLIKAGESKDANELFEKAHAMKGVCANLGLTVLSDAASEISEEFRQGNKRGMTDEEVDEKLAYIAELYEKTVEGIQKYEEGN